MATKHTVTDSRGKVHKRTSQNRVYAFAIVTHYPERRAAWDPNVVYHAYSKAEWSSTRELAENAKRRSQRCGYEAEIIPAVVS